MNIYISPIVFFQLICICQGLTTALLLLFSSSKIRSNLWLGLLLCGMTLNVLDYFLANTGIYYRHNNLYFMPIFFSWSFGPLLYYYLSSLFQKQVKVNFLAFLPVLAQFLFYSFVAFHQLGYKTWFWQHVHKPYTRYVDYYGMCAIFLVYMWLAYQKFKTEIKEIYWLKNLLLALSIFFALALADPIINTFYQPVSMPKFYMITFLLPVTSFWMVLIGLLTERFKWKINNKPAGNFDAQVLAAIKTKMEGEKLYRDAGISVQLLAVNLNVTANVISKTINNAIGKSFNDYLNELRVNEVKQRLKGKDKEKFTLLAIAFDAGFNSKSTFNRVFKHHTGFSPKEYLGQDQNMEV